MVSHDASELQPAGSPLLEIYATVLTSAVLLPSLSLSSRSLLLLALDAPQKAGYCNLFKLIYFEMQKDYMQNNNTLFLLFQMKMPVMLACAKKHAAMMGVGTNFWLDLFMGVLIVSFGSLIWLISHLLYFLGLFYCLPGEVAGLIN